jgi:hypothetical protein
MNFYNWRKLSLLDLNHNVLQVEFKNEKNPLSTYYLVLAFSSSQSHIFNINMILQVMYYE